ncbi:hypothetical protein [Rhizobium sp. HT1-10]|uniref:hypothetical protein n=1 Tax=Rhizobium sp. HT1-10 TaxID=3111638 RepID=UPI003C1A2CBA
MKLLFKLGAAGLIALGALSAVAPSVSAAGLSSTVETVRYDRHHDARSCSPLVAVRKARAYGLRHAEISRINPRRVVVTGRTRHGMDRIVFANQRGCPMLRR